MVGIGPGKYTSISLPVHFNITPSICSHSAQYIQRCPSNEKEGYKFSYNYKLYPGKSLRFPVISLILQLGNGKKHLVLRTMGDLLYVNTSLARHTHRITYWVQKNWTLFYHMNCKLVRNKTPHVFLDFNFFSKKINWYHEFNLCDKLWCLVTNKLDSWRWGWT